VFRSEEREEVTDTPPSFWQTVNGKPRSVLGSKTRGALVKSRTRLCRVSPFSPLKLRVKKLGLVALSLLSSPAAARLTDRLPLVIVALASSGSRSCGLVD